MKVNAERTGLKWRRACGRLWGLGAVLMVLIPQPSAGQGPIFGGSHLMRDTYVELAYLRQWAGLPLGREGWLGTGIHLQERDGYFSEALWSPFAYLFGLNRRTANDKKQYEPGYALREYTLMSRAELDAVQAERDEALAEIRSNGYHSDLKVFFPMGSEGDLWGVTFETYPVSYNYGLLSFDVGLLWSDVYTACGPEGQESAETCRARSLGVPLKISCDLWGFALLDVQYDWNWLSFFGASAHTAHPQGFRAGATFHPWQRLFVRADLLLPDFDTSSRGLAVEGGVRF